MKYGKRLLWCVVMVAAVALVVALDEGAEAATGIGCRQWQDGDWVHPSVAAICLRQALLQKY